MRTTFFQLSLGFVEKAGQHNVTLVVDELPTRKLVLLDTRRWEGVSGKRAEKLRGLREGDTNKMVKELQDFGAVVFTSSRRGEFSRESSQCGHGTFTYALLKGLKGEASPRQEEVITMKELDAYVSKKVPELTGGTRHPITFTPDGYLDFPIAKEK
jgi:uncharacterized caspase-like protein